MAKKKKLSEEEKVREKIKEKLLELRTCFMCEYGEEPIKTRCIRCIFSSKILPEFKKAKKKIIKERMGENE